MKPGITSLFVLTALGLGFQELGAQGSGARTSMIEVAGVTTRYRTVGLDSRASGSSVVVFQNGAGSPLERTAGSSVLVSMDAGDSVQMDTPGIVVQEIRRMIALTTQH